MTNISFTFDVIQYRPEDNFMQVRYQRLGYPDVIKNFAAPDSSEAIDVARSSPPMSQWQAHDTAQNSDIGSVLNAATQSGSVEAPAAPNPPTDEERIVEHIHSIALARFEKEASGIIWEDANSETWYLDTSLSSQARVTGAKTAVDAGIRTDGGVWKCAKVNTSTQAMDLTFRPTLNSEISEWATLVHAHVQKCFEVEAVCLGKIQTAIAQSDMTALFQVNFNTEFDSYNSP